MFFLDIFCFNSFKGKFWHKSQIDLTARKHHWSFALCTMFCVKSNSCIESAFYFRPQHYLEWVQQCIHCVLVPFSLDNIFYFTLIWLKPSKPKCPWKVFNNYRVSQNKFMIDKWYFGWIFASYHDTWKNFKYKSHTEVIKLYVSLLLYLKKNHLLGCHTLSFQETLVFKLL